MTLNNAYRSESFSELIYRIKKGGNPPMRPDLAANDVDVNPSIVSRPSDMMCPQRLLL